MRKLFFVLLGLTIILSDSFSQIIYQSDFEQFTVGSYLAQSDPQNWTTWTNQPGTSEDAVISDTYASSGTKSVLITGSTDVVLPLANYTSGYFEISFKMYIPSGYYGYFNILQLFDGSNSQWGMQVFFNAGGTGIIYGGLSAPTFIYSNDTWMLIENKIDIDSDIASFYINNILIHSWQWSTGSGGTSDIHQLGGIDMYAWNEIGTDLHFFDDLKVEKFENPFTQIGNLYSVFFSDPTNGWAVGQDGISINSQGTTWAFPLNISYSDLHSTFFINSDYGFAVGENGTILFYDGQNWIEQASGTTSDLYSVFFIDPLIGWAVGENGTILFYNGENWISQNSGSNNKLKSVYFSNNSNGWAVGSNGTILHYNGVNWTSQASGTTNMLNSINFSSNGEGWIVGTNGTMLKKSGNNWILKPNITTNNINQISFDEDASTGVAVGNNGLIIQYNGIEWIVQPNITSHNLFSINKGWIVGEGGTVLDYKTGFKTLPQINLSHPLSIFFLNESNGWISTVVNIQKYDGISWTTQIMCPLNGFYNCLYMLNANLGYRVGPEGSIYKYNGASWTQQPSPTTEELGSVFFTDATHGWAVGSNGTIIRCIGTTWGTQTSPTSLDLHSVCFTDVSHGWAVGFGSILFYNGTVWSIQASGINDELFSVSFIDNNNGWAVGSNGTGTNGIILHYDGINWTNYESYTGEILRSVDFSSANHGLIVGDAGTILKYNGEQWENISINNIQEQLTTVHYLNDSCAYFADWGSNVYKYEGNEGWNIYLPGSFTIAGPIAILSGAPTSGYAPMDVQFTDLSTEGSNPISTWLWDFGDGNNSTEENPVHTYLDAGNYNVSLSVSDGSLTDEETITNYINVFEPLIIDAGTDQYIQTGTSTYVEGNVMGGSGDFNYLWEPSSLLINPNSIGTQTIPINYDTTLIFTVEDIVVGYYASDSLFIQTYVGIKETDEFKDVYVYPNPFREKINIYINLDLQTEGKINITLYDVYGRVVLNLSNIESKPVLSISNLEKLPKGLYTIKLWNNMMNKLFGVVHFE